MESKDKQIMSSCWDIGKSINRKINCHKSICNLCNLDKREDNPIQEYYIIEIYENSACESELQNKVPANKVKRRKSMHNENILRNEEHERSLFENYKQSEEKESRLEQQENYPKLIKFQRGSHFFHRLIDLKNILILSFLLSSTLTTVKTSDITVNHEKIVLKKGDEITLKCTSDSEALGKVIYTKYSKY